MFWAVIGDFQVPYGAAAIDVEIRKLSASFGRNENLPITHLSPDFALRFARALPGAALSFPVETGCV